MTTPKVMGSGPQLTVVSAPTPPSGGSVIDFAAQLDAAHLDAAQLAAAQLAGAPGAVTAAGAVMTGGADGAQPPTAGAPGQARPHRPGEQDGPDAATDPVLSQLAAAGMVPVLPPTAQAAQAAQAAQTAQKIPAQTLKSQAGVPMRSVSDAAAAPVKRESPVRVGPAGDAAVSDPLAGPSRAPGEPPPSGSAAATTGERLTSDADLASAAAATSAAFSVLPERTRSAKSAPPDADPDTSLVPSASAAAPPAVPTLSSPASAAAPAEVRAPVRTHEPITTALTPLRAHLDGEHRLVVQLHPAELGPVSVTARIEHGAITVALTAGADAAHDALTAALPMLREDLQQAGFAAVQLSLGGDAPDRSGRFAPRGQDAAPERDAPPEPGTRPRAVRATSSSAVDRWL